MKIIDVEAIAVTLPTIAGEEANGTQDALIIKVHTDAGITGVGEVDSSPYVAKAIIEAPVSHSMCHGLRDLVIGEDPFDTERIWQKMYHRSYYYGRVGIGISAMSGIDMALWDIKGKALDKPLYKVLGGAYKSSWIKESGHPLEISAYDSTLFPNDPDDLDYMRAKAQKAVDQGFTGLKFGWQGFGDDQIKDYALLEAARDVVGDGFKIMVDVGLKWDAKTAIKEIQYLRDLNIFWFEEPVAADDFRGYRRIAEATNSSWIVGGEHLYTYKEFERFLDEGQVDAIQPDLSRTGGFTEVLKIGMMAAQRNVPVVLHGYSTDILAKGMLHYLVATPNARMLEFCTEGSPIRWNLTKNPLLPEHMHDGRFRVPEDPGLGVELNDEEIEKYALIYDKRIKEQMENRR